MLTLCGALTLNFEAPQMENSFRPNDRNAPTSSVGSKNRPNGGS
ncbi:MAG: hypothetical protein ACTS80_01345 [Candidatus Hodgkinia cicadicola]